MNTSQKYINCLKFLSGLIHSLPYKMIPTFRLPTRLLLVSCLIFLMSLTYGILVNGYNRFEYLTKSVSRTATITRRRIDSASDDSLGTPPVSNSRFGTITKGTIHPNETHSNGSPVNTNTITKNRGSYVVKRMLPLLNGIHPMSNEESTPPSDLESSNTNRTYVILEPHDQHDLSSDSSTDLLGNETHSNGFPVNTNTITKNRRSYLVKRLLPVPNGIHPMSNEESAPSSDFEISNNDDLNIDLNRNYEPYPTDSDDTVSSGRNYPTITRNNTRTLLVRRETSQGSLKSRLASQSKKNCLASSSNEDLLSDNSALSIHSNLSMTSSMSGRSEPNLIGVQNLAIYNKSVSNAQTNKYQSRLAGPSNKPQVVSRTKPLLQGGLNKRVPNSRLPNSSVNSFGSMGSLQSNMTRGVSKVSPVTLCLLNVLAPICALVELGVASWFVSNVFAFCLCMLSPVWYQPLCPA